MTENKMFCYQCQETAGCTGCTQVGVCGKKPDVAAMQDLLVYVTKGLSAVTTRLRAEGKEISNEINHLVTLNLFTTITCLLYTSPSFSCWILKSNLCLPQVRLWWAQVDSNHRPPAYQADALTG